MKTTPAPEAAPEEQHSHLVRSALLIVAMSVVSLFMWIGVPLAWLWIAAQVSSDYQTIYL